MVVLNKSAIDNLTCPEVRRDVLVFDERLPGFGLRIAASGTKSFLVQYNRNRKVRRIVLGRYGMITPAEARRKAIELLGQVQAGRDPVAERQGAKDDRQAAQELRQRQEADQAKRDAFTAGSLLDAWEAVKLKAKSTSYRREAPRCVRQLLGTLSSSPAAAIGRADVQARLDAGMATAPVQSFNARAYGRAAWNWAIKRGYVAENPFANVSVEYQVQSRDRVLDDGELGEAWRAAAARPYPFGPLVRLMILTLQRRGEVSGMCWSEISGDLSQWIIPAERCKNGRAHIVHLVPEARAILKEIFDAWPEESRADRPDFVFTVTGETAVSGHSRAKALIDADIEKERLQFSESNARRSPATWHFHDFRRTGVTKMAEMGVAPHVADRVLNHVGGTISGVAAVYQRAEFLAERQRALEIWAAHVLAAALDTEAPSNVLQMQRRPRSAG